MEIEQRYPVAYLWKYEDKPSQIFKTMGMWQTSQCSEQINTENTEYIRTAFKYWNSYQRGQVKCLINVYGMRWTQMRHLNAYCDGRIERSQDMCDFTQSAEFNKFQ